ncbi:MAG: ribbon-helix-helix protein, CopG family, partial [Spirochaetaceae bacterium]|nr:ribbon-helix-helix protein, CopG family [Spirochaetaceae bacterium]
SPMPTPVRPGRWGSLTSIDFGDELRRREESVSQITARLPDDLVGALDAAARELNRSRADLVRQAIERYLEDFDDLSIALERLRDPTDPVLDWDDVRRNVLGPD